MLCFNWAVGFFSLSAPGSGMVVRCAGNAQEPTFHQRHKVASAELTLSQCCCSSERRNVEPQFLSLPMLYMESQSLFVAELLFTPP